MAKLIGIDYGAQMSGKTVIACLTNKGVSFLQVHPKKHTDTWLINQLQNLNPETVYIDAPLSLPLAYTGQGDNFHYRKADELTKAMSPLFLGGLTARAMSLKHRFASIRFVEIYPAYFQSQIIQSPFYKKDIRLFLHDLNKKEPILCDKIPQNWHQVDALLALVIGIRHQENRHLEVGNPTEGIIVL